MKEAIAIVGMSALFPGADSLPAFWQNILDGVDATSEAEPSWSSPYYDPDSTENDRIYTRRGGFLKDLSRFNPAAFGVMPNTLRGSEPDHFIALRLAQEALDDAGYGPRPFDRRRTGVIVGHATLLNRGNVTLLQHGMMVDQTLDLLSKIRPDLSADELAWARGELKKSLPAFDADVAPGMTPNVLSGRIANRLDLMGPNFIIDAACSSSLVALELACRELIDGRCDMMLTGGVNVSTSPQVFMVFCRLGALSRSKIRPFSTEASGTLLGEGAGMLVLKRLSDAERDDDRIYAVIRGIGVSSDGKALGMMAPRFEGEVLALERAYEDAAVPPASIGLIEAHGTGIPLGDRTEIRSLTRVFGERQGELPRCAIGSVKSMISHTIPAAGAASLIKTSLALYHKVLPPTLCEEVNPALELEKTPFYVNNRARPWLHGGDSPRRAGVNAFGFGGINAHAVLEEYPARASEHHYRRWPSELLLISAADRDGVITLIDRLTAICQSQPAPALGALARSLWQEKPAPCRLAIVARSSEDLQKKLAFARKNLAAGKSAFRTRDGSAYSENAQRPRIAFLLPGEGSQYPGMLGDLCQLFPSVREHFDRLESAFQPDTVRPGEAMYPPPTALSAGQDETLRATLYSLDTASGIVSTACLALFKLLGDFGVRADAMLGHSTGEFASLTASGAFRFADGSRFVAALNHVRDISQSLEAGGSIPRGALLTVGGVARERIDALIAESAGRLLLAMDNCANQIILFGTPADIEAARPRIAELGGIASLLPFDRAYHTPLFEEVRRALKPFYASLTVETPQVPLYSCVTAGRFPDDPAAIRELAAEQWASPVRFSETIERLYADGVRVFVEVGPSGNLTAFVNDILRGRDALALTVNSPNRPGLEQLQIALADLFVRGCEIDPSPLFIGRELPLLDLDQPMPARRPAGQALPLELPRLDLGQATERLAAQPQAAAPAAAAPALAAPAPSTTPADPRAAFLQGHFALMNDFLAQQQRLLAGLGVGAPAVPAAPAANNTPLIERVVERGPGHLLGERRFTVASAPFLADHVFGGPLSDRQDGITALPVVPFTVSIEMLAQAALQLAGGGVVSELIDIRGSRWLALDRGDLTLRARVERLAEAADLYRGSLFLVEEQSMVLVFEARIRVSAAYPAAPAPAPFPMPGIRPSHWQDPDLYRTGMFHGPMFQTVRHVCGYTADAIEAEAEVPDSRNFLAGRSAELKTPVALLDAVGQLVAYWFAEIHRTADFNTFPYHIEKIRLFAPPPAAATPVLLRGRWREPSPGWLEGGCDILRRDGTPLLRVDGMRQRAWGNISYPSYYRCRVDPRRHLLSDPWPVLPGLVARHVAPFPSGFLDDSWAIWKRALAHLMLGAREREHWYALADGLRTQWLLGRIAAKDAVREFARQQHGIELAPIDIEILSDRLGRPQISCPWLPAPLPAVSISHTRGHAIAVAGMGAGLGIDFENLESFRAGEEVGRSFAADEQALFAHWPDRNEAVLACWGAREAAAKAAGTGLLGRPAAWRIVAVEAAGDQRRISVSHGNQTFRTVSGRHQQWVWTCCHN